MVVTALLLAVSLSSAQKVESPKLADAVKLKIVTVQLEQSMLEAEFSRLQLRLGEIRSIHDQNQLQLAKLIGTALKDSNIDGEKYDLNPQTLEVVVKPPKQEKK